MHKITARVMHITIFVILLGVGLILQNSFVKADDPTATPTDQQSAPMPPTTPLNLSISIQTDNTPTVSWAASQPGSSPLGYYLVQRSDDNATYTTITQVDYATTQFNDPSGTPGQWYRIIAVDNQDPATQSSPSDPIQVPPPASDVTSSPQPTDTGSGTSTSTQSTNSQNTNTTTQTNTSSSDVSSSSTPTSSDVSAALNTVNQLDNAAIDKSLELTPVNTVSTSIDSTPIVMLTEAHPLVHPQAPDTELNTLFKSVDGTQTAVTDLSSLQTQVTQDDSHATVQPTGKKVSLLNGSSDTRVVYLYNAIVQGKGTLVMPLLDRYNYEKTSIIDLKDRLSSDEEKTAKANCSTQSNLLTADLFILPVTAQYAVTESLAKCGVIHDF